MAKCNTKSYVIEINLATSENDDAILETRFRIVHHITNVLVKHAIHCIKNLERDKTYKMIMNNYSKTKKFSNEEKDVLSSLRLKYGLSEYQFHDYAKTQSKMYNLGSAIVQKIATRTWSSVYSYLFKNGEMIHFKKYRDIKSYENKCNGANITFKNNTIYNNGLKMPIKYKKNDVLINNALKDIENNYTKVKYCRIIRRWHKNKYVYKCQLILEGIPPKKKNIPTLIDKTVGIDIGTSTIAVVSDNNCIFKELAENITLIDREKRRLQRHRDRQNRANNPNNFNIDGTVKKGCKYWYRSNAMIKTDNKIKALCQKRSNQLKQSHILLANEILKLGSNIIVEDMQWSALAKKSKKTEISNKTGKYKKKKRFGKTIANHAPSTLIDIINTKLSYIDKQVNKVDCFKTCATKFNHVTGEFMDTDLNTRFVNINGNEIQRDLHSAFNLKYIIISKDKYDYDVNAMNENFDSFISKHNELLDSLKNQKQLGHKFPSCMGI